MMNNKLTIGYYLKNKIKKFQITENQIINTNQKNKLLSSKNLPWQKKQNLQLETEEYRKWFKK
mgnify:CR=1 FL=1